MYLLQKYNIVCLVYEACRATETNQRAQTQRLFLCRCHPGQLHAYARGALRMCVCVFANDRVLSYHT